MTTTCQSAFECIVLVMMKSMDLSFNWYFFHAIICKNLNSLILYKSTSHWAGLSLLTLMVNSSQPVLLSQLHQIQLFTRQLVSTSGAFHVMLWWPHLWIKLILWELKSICMQIHSIVSINQQPVTWLKTLHKLVVVVYGVAFKTMKGYSVGRVAVALEIGNIDH